MSPRSIAEDKQRILDQLRVNFLNLPDDDDECWALFPQTAAQVRSILRTLYVEDFRPAEMQALLSLLGPVLSRRIPGQIPQRRRLHAV